MLQFEVKGRGILFDFEVEETNDIFFTHLVMLTVSWLECTSFALNWQTKIATLQQNQWSAVSARSSANHTPCNSVNAVECSKVLHHGPIAKKQGNIVVMLHTLNIGVAVCVRIVVMLAFDRTCARESRG